MKNNVRFFREQAGFTQAELAEKSNLSIRTIQRVEASQSAPKGHTLKALAESLGVEKKDLSAKPSSPKFIEPLDDQNLKLINLSALCFLGIPFGNIIVPIFLWRKYREHEQVDELGRRIINFQIIWTVCTSVLLILMPFCQDFFPDNITLILIVGLLAVLLNLIVIGKTAVELSRADYDILPLKWRFI